MHSNRSASKDENVNIHTELSKGEDFNLLEELNLGSLCNVYLAQWKAMKNTSVVIKLGLLKENQAEWKVLQDLNAKSNLLKENDARKYTIVKLLTSYIHENDLGIVLEYADYGSLANFIGKTSAFENLKLKFAKQIAYGINFLHQNEYVHRDVKSDNILVTKNLTVKITDFDLCKKIDEIEKEMVGTYHTMAPEIMRGREHTYKSDIFSAAIVCYEILEWTQAYKDLSIYRIQSAVLNEKRPVISNKRSPNLARLITLGWMNDPNERPTSEEMIKILDNDSNNHEIENDNANYFSSFCRLS